MPPTPKIERAGPGRPAGSQGSPRQLAGHALVCGLALALPLPLAAAAIDGFFPTRGEGDIVLSTTCEKYDRFWMGETEVTHPDVGEVETWSEMLWGRFGVTQDLAVIFNLPYVDVDSTGAASYSDQGFQDAAALLSWRAVGHETASGRHTLALAGGVRTPATSYEANLPVDMGDGTTDVLLHLAWQSEIGPFYVTQALGYELRGGDAPDGFPLQTTVGYGLGPVTASLAYALYEADGGTDIGDPGATFPSNEDEYERAGVGLYARLAETWGLTAGYFDTLDGRNSADLAGFSLGVVYRVR